MNMASNLKKTAILYIRTSTTDQKNSIKLQKKDLNEYCAQNNIEVIATYEDFGVSGKNAYERPEFSKLMDLIRNSEVKPADIILCTKLDRFARSTLDLLVNVEEITKKEMEFRTLNQQFETKTPQGKLLFNILGAFAEFERDLIYERTREGYIAAKNKGKICNRPKLKVDKKKVLEYIEKGLSAHAIAKILDSTIPNDNKKKGKLSATTIKNRLNEWGYVYQNGKWVKRDESE
jgi:Site-specific recombinases, DNA invertase Pin homologs